MRISDWSSDVCSSDLLAGKCSRGIRMLSLDDAQKRAEKLVEAARKIGADAADALYICDASTQVQMRLGLLEDVERSEGEDIGLRVFSGRRSATVSSRSEEHTSELQSLMRNSYAVFCLKKKNNKNE